MASVADLNYQRRLVEQAAEKGRTAVAYLYRADGTPRFSPEEQKESIAAALVGLRAAVTAAQEVAAMAQEDARKRATAAHVDPLSKLTTEELQRYTLLRPLVVETVGQLNGVPLVDRLQAIADHGDRIDKLAYLDALASREGDITELLPALMAMERSLVDPAAKAATDQATELRKAASQLSFDASRTLAEMDGSEAAAMEAKRQEYAAYF